MKAFSLTICVFGFLTTQLAMGQPVRVSPSRPVVCYQSEKNLPLYVRAPQKFREWAASRSAQAQTATFVVDYVNFPADNQAKNAFQFAVDIWATELKSQVPIRVRAQWAPLEAGVLGQAIWGTAFANFAGAQQLNTFYPVALAEKMSGVALNDPSEADVVATFNSNASWYFGTDGNTPAQKMDLVTIVLHEIAHGIGFSDTYDVEGTSGTVGLENGGVALPFVYDVFVENLAEAKLFSGFSSPSVALGNQLTSANLFYDSRTGEQAVSGSRIKIYAPTNFNQGSSIAHLDEATYNNTVNTLMTPQVAFMEAVHDPGDVLTGMLADMGWVFTRIQHSPLKDTERKNGAPYIVNAIITSDVGFDPVDVKLNFTTNGTDFTTVTMVATGVPNQFQAALPGTTQEKQYGYFISVVDDDGRVFTNPGKIQEQNSAPAQDIIVITIGPDATPPQIAHSPPDHIEDGTASLVVNAEVTDNIGVEKVFMEFSIDGGMIQTTSMKKQSSDLYSAIINLPSMEIGDYIEYRIVAIDTSLNANVNHAPSTGFFKVVVKGILPVKDLYVNNFNEPTSDFIGSSYSIMTPSGFVDGAVHSAHPYLNGSGPDDESSYTFELQVPIRINGNNPWIYFDEIVLVEPGETNSKFGDDDFYDYVIVEGSADRGTTWKRFLDGYDSRANPVWLTRYNSNISNDNSQAVGNAPLFVSRTINMLENGNFLAGNEVLIRFRLFADQAAHGWGWAIDNLSIQGPVTGLEKPVSDELEIFPNPAEDHLAVKMLTKALDVVVLQITNAQGQIVFQHVNHAVDGQFEQQVDLQGYTAGLYHIRVTQGKKTISKKVLVGK